MCFRASPMILAFLILTTLSSLLLTCNKHCDHLVNVLNRFRVHNLRVKATKCHFGAKSVRLLGHVVFSKGVHTDPQKIDVVSTLSIPRSIEHVRSFLGLAGYYRHFLPNLATIAAPLVRLTRKRKQFLLG